MSQPPGSGGLIPPPLNAPAGQATPVGVQPGTFGQIIARRVIISGPGGELFVYSPSAGAGNLVLSVSGTVGGGTDTYGNHFVFGLGVYDAAGGFFTQYGAGFMTFGTGSLASGWTANTSIQNDASGDLFLNSAPGAHVFANGTQIG